MCYSAEIMSVIMFSAVRYNCDYQVHVMGHGLYVG